MAKNFVRVLCNVDCKWEGFEPIYRVYVNEELFAERTWIWTDEYLEEALQIEAEPGEYYIKYELVPPHSAQLSVSNMRVDYGPGEMNGTILRIKNESQ